LRSGVVRSVTERYFLKLQSVESERIEAVSHTVEGCILR
jgi:hypothetical protein